MLNNKKHKVLLFSLAILLIAGVGSVIAFIMTSTGSVENAFTPSNVSCIVDETINNDEKSDVKIRNNGDTRAYIRASIVATWVKPVEGSATEFETYGRAPVEGTDYEIVYGNVNNDLEAAGWFEQDGFYYYKTAVAEGESTNNLIYMCKPKGNNAPDGYILSVEIIASAIQADGESMTLDTAVENDNLGKSPVELAWGVDPSKL